MRRGFSILFHFQIGYKKEAIVCGFPFKQQNAMNFYDAQHI